MVDDKKATTASTRSFVPLCNAPATQCLYKVIYPMSRI